MLGTEILNTQYSILSFTNDMFSGFTGSKSNSSPDFGERMLNAVATQSIRHLFTRSEQVDVVMRCHPASKLLQGSIDSFKMTGRQLVIRRQFEVEEMSFETDAVAIDFSSVLGGKLRLKQPTQAVAQIVLAEDAINRAFTADLVKVRLQQLDLPPLTNLSGGEPVSFRDVQVTLLPDNAVRIEAKTDLPNRADIPIQLTATLAIEKRRRILFQNPQFNDADVSDEVRGISEILTNAFAEVLNEMVDLDRFDLDGVTLRLNRLETHGKQLLFSGYAQIDRFPGVA
jgi:LmeA-like phospholipid-binding